MASSVRTALYGALTGDAALTGLLATPTSVFHQVAPLSAPFPYVIFAKQAGNPAWAFGDGRLDSALWLVKVVSEGLSARPAEDAAKRADEVLNDAALTLSEDRLLYIRRESDVEYLEQVDADMWHHVGAMYRVITEPA